MKTQRTHSPFPAILVVALSAPLLHAQIWDGGGSDDLFGTGANWNPDGAPPVGDTVDLIFAGNTRLTPVNNYTDWDDFRNIDFAAGAGAFTITGNPIDLHGRIENQGSNLQTVSLDLAISGSQGTRGEFNPVGGDLLINGGNVFTNGHTLQIWGDNGHTVTFNTLISGDGGLSVNQNSNVVLVGTNTYTGGTIVNAGILNLTSGGESGVIRGSLTINEGAQAHLSANDATGWGTSDQRISAININGGTLQINTTGGGGQNQTFSNMAITMTGGTISGAAAGSSFDFFNGSSSLTTLASADTATVSVNANLRQENTTFTVENGGAEVDLLWSGTLNQTGAGRNFIKAGDGRMDLTSAGTWSGTTSINGGTLRLANNGTLLNTSSVTVNTGATLETARDNIFTTGHGAAMAADRVVTLNNATWHISNGNLRAGNVTLNDGATWTSSVDTAWGILLANTSDANASTVTVSGSGASTMNGTGALRLQGIQNFHVNNVTGPEDADLTVSLILRDPGNAGGAAGGIRKTGDGTLLLNNTASNFNGDIIISGGRIVTGTSQGGGATGYLGVVNDSRTITVESGGVLDFRANNQFGGGGKTAANIPAIVLDGGTLTSTRFNIIGNLTLNAGTLTQSATDSGSYEGYQFLGTVTVGGDSASTISTGNGKANHLRGGATTVFDVADGNAAADLIVSAPLRDGSGDYSGIGSLEKTGEGTMLLDAANTYTGNTLVSVGTLLVNGSLGASAVTVSSGAAFGGTGTIGGSVSFDADATFHIADIYNSLSVEGTITFGSGFDVTNLIGIDWDSLDLHTPYTLISTTQTFTASDIGSFGIGNALPIGDGDRLAYFENGSLQVIVIPEPAAIALGSLGLLTLLRRRRD